MKKIYLIVTFILTVSVSINAQTPNLTLNIAPGLLSSADKIYIKATLDIPSDGYIYGNPKGPGTGKSLAIQVSPAKILDGTIMISPPQMYTSDGDIGFVNIYRNTAEIYIPVKIDSSQQISITADGLFCSSNGRCTPFQKTTVSDLSRNSVNGQIPGESIAFGKSLSSEDTTQLQEGSGSVLPHFAPRYISDSVSGLLIAVIFGIIAGLILNFMPCVLPVLTLKITTLVSHAHDRRLIVKTGLSYTFGVLTSFCFLAALAAFAGMGWGSLFQQSGFIIVMTLLLFIFSLSLLGVFTLNLPGFAGRAASTQFGNVAVDSYIKGLMASLLATPCSGPLLGATLAWSLSQPPYIVFTVFTAIGIGMALPYIIISIYPPIVSFIPKPGNWTVIFERVMGFLLLGSVIYFISVLSDDLFIPTLVMLFVSGISIWQYGEWGNLSRSGISQKVSRIVLILLLIAALSIPVYWSNRPSKTVIAQNSYTFSNLQSLARGGQITAVQFTADWCPNCRIVERSVLYTKETEALFKEKNVTLLVADITQSGTEGEKLLHALGSSSIPFLAFFPAGNSFNNPICLRDLYSEKDIVEALRLAGK